MKTIELLQNTIQHYAWGSPTAIPDLLEQENPSGQPWAELWMGAHPKAPSQINRHGRWVSLIDLIREKPEEILGPQVARQFDRKLPYLFKVLAASKPLSIQAHPNLDQARRGFNSENEQNIPLDAAHRNYKDDNHKPECICALTEFIALQGFRAIPEIVSMMTAACPVNLAHELQRLKTDPGPKGLKHFYSALMNLESPVQKQVVAEALQNSAKIPDADIAFWMERLAEAYPADLGILSPILLNLIRLRPGQALFLPAGELHAYLKGLGIELMANSDNVLRGGLTPKHIDLPELLRVVRFEPRPIGILKAEARDETESVFVTPAHEFVLSTITTSAEAGYLSLQTRSAEILLCTDGDAFIEDIDGGSRLAMKKGDSVMVPSAVARYRISGSASFFKAATPVRHDQHLE
jgi:mannose-6-phosphate isomerase